MMGCCWPSLFMYWFKPNLSMKALPQHQFGSWALFMSFNGLKLVDFVLICAQGRPLVGEPRFEKGCHCQHPFFMYWFKLNLAMGAPQTPFIHLFIFIVISWTCFRFVIPNLCMSNAFHKWIGVSKSIVITNTLFWGTISRPTYNESIVPTIVGPFFVSFPRVKLVYSLLI